MLQENSNVEINRRQYCYIQALLVVEHTKPISQPSLLFVDAELVGALEIVANIDPKRQLKWISLTSSVFPPSFTNCMFIVRPTPKNASTIARFAGRSNSSTIYFVPHASDHITRMLYSVPSLDPLIYSLDWSYTLLDLDLISFSLPHCLRASLMEGQITFSSFIAKGLYDIFRHSSIPQRFVVKGDISEAVFEQLNDYFNSPDTITSLTSISALQSHQFPPLPFTFDTVFIFDRTADLISPLLTPHTYMGRILELLNVNEDLLLTYTPKILIKPIQQPGQTKQSIPVAQPLLHPLLRCSDHFIHEAGDYFMSTAIDWIVQRVRELTAATHETNRQKLNTEELKTYAKQLGKRLILQKLAADVHSVAIETIRGPGGSLPFADRVHLELGILLGQEQTSIPSIYNPQSTLVNLLSGKSRIGKGEVRRDIMQYIEEAMFYSLRRTPSLIAGGYPPSPFGSGACNVSGASFLQPRMKSYEVNQIQPALFTPQSTYIPSHASIIRLLLLHTASSGGLSENEFNIVRIQLLKHIGYGFIRDLIQLEQKGLFRAGQYSTETSPYVCTSPWISKTQPLLPHPNETQLSSAGSATIISLQQSLTSYEKEYALNCGPGYFQGLQRQRDSFRILTSVLQLISGGNIDKSPYPSIFKDPKDEKKIKDSKDNTTSNNNNNKEDEDDDYSSIFVQYAPILTRLVQFAFAPYGWRLIEKPLMQYVPGKTIIWIREQQTDSNNSNLINPLITNIRNDEDILDDEKRLYQKVFNISSDNTDNPISNELKGQFQAPQQIESEEVVNGITDYDIHHQCQDDSNIWITESGNEIIDDGDGFIIKLNEGGMIENSDNAGNDEQKKDQNDQKSMREKLMGKKTIIVKAPEALNLAQLQEQERAKRKKIELKRSFFKQIPLSDFDPIDPNPPISISSQLSSQNKIEQPTQLNTQPNSETPAIDEQLTQQPVQSILIVVIGGLTLPEIACFRHLGRKIGRNFVFASTSFESGTSMIERLLGWK
ncbi:MAG: hypothetical protein EZS28_004361 [Streblomastix strix]|uniref:Vacuolar protein sorting-associated protein 33A n=1 Tax=Streblomastix strix TaxID=222440 RepID=A0A5J4WZZ1_9EUKA|nr:MAG: hypothetical protein EZS28_004361 [Streblomastix strix]